MKFCGGSVGCGDQFATCQTGCGEVTFPRFGDSCIAIDALQDSNPGSNPELVFNLSFGQPGRQGLSSLDDAGLPYSNFRHDALR